MKLSHLHASALKYTRWHAVEMHSHCPACGAELHAVMHEYHYGYYVKAGLLYWQYCDAGDCTFMGGATLFKARIA